MILRETIIVNKNTAAFINHALNVEPAGENDCFGEDEKISYTATFSNGYQADVECIGVQYHEGENNTAWTQAVLFNPDGSEVNCTPPDSTFFGEWWIMDENENEYFINVVSEDDLGDVLSDEETELTFEKNTSRAEKRRVRRKAISRKSMLIKAKASAGNPEILTEMTAREVGKLAKGKPFPWSTKERHIDRITLSGRKFQYKKSVLRKLDRIEYRMAEYAYAEKNVV